MDREGTLYVADAQNYLIRMIKPITSVPADAAEKKEPDVFIQPATVTVNTNADDVIPRLSRSTLNIGQVFPWPLNPQYQWHEVAGVVGEAPARREASRSIIFMRGWMYEARWASPPFLL